jgi:hypothetical protein
VRYRLNLVWQWSLMCRKSDKDLAVKGFRAY